MFINEFSSYTPEMVVNINSHYEKLNISEKEAKVYTKLYGFSDCPLYSDNLIPLLRKSLDPLLLNKSSGFIKSIKVLIYVHTGANVSSINKIIPNEISRIYKIPTTLCFGTSTNNCVGVLYAMKLSNIYLSKLPNDSKALIITGEIANNIGLRVIHNIAIAGDASSAFILSKQKKGFKVIFTETKVYSQYFAGIWLDPNSELQKSFENHYQDRVTDIINLSLSKYNLSITDIDYINPHNVNVWIWKNTAKRLHIDVSKIFLSNVNKTAHCFSSDMILNIDNMQINNMIKVGKKILVVTAGVGGFFGAALLQVI